MHREFMFRKSIILSYAGQLLLGTAREVKPCPQYLVRGPAYLVIVNPLCSGIHLDERILHNKVDERAGVELA